MDDKLFFVDVPATEAKSQKKEQGEAPSVVAPLITSLPSLDPHISRKQREPDREEQALIIVVSAVPHQLPAVLTSLNWLFSNCHW